jgi:hypothetical protein
MAFLPLCPNMIKGQEVDKAFVVHYLLTYGIAISGYSSVTYLYLLLFCRDPGESITRLASRARRLIALYLDMTGQR